MPLSRVFTGARFFEGVLVLHLTCFFVFYIHFAPFWPLLPERRWVCLKRLMAHRESKCLAPENSFNLHLDTFDSCLLSLLASRACVYIYIYMCVCMCVCAGERECIRQRHIWRYHKRVKTCDVCCVALITSPTVWDVICTSNYEGCRRQMSAVYLQLTINVTSYLPCCTVRLRR